MGHRDHSWGTRDWGALHFYRWLQSQAGEDMSVHFWEFYALGERQLRGYVCKAGLMAEITTPALRWQGDAQFNHPAFQADLVDEAGRHTPVDAQVFVVYPPAPAHAFSLHAGEPETPKDPN